MRLEELRTKEEILIYFKKLGKEITEEEIEALKQSYNQAKQNNRALTLQQLDNVVGGINFYINGSYTKMKISGVFSPGLKREIHVIDSRLGKPITEQSFSDLKELAYTFGKTIIENGIKNVPLEEKKGYHFSSEEESLLKQLGEIINGPTFEQDARRYRLEVARSNPAYHDFREIFDKFPVADEKKFSSKSITVKSVLDMASTLVKSISFEKFTSEARPFEIYTDNFIVFNSLVTLAPEKCLNIFARVIDNTFSISDKLPLKDKLTDRFIKGIFEEHINLFEIDGNEHSKIILESANEIFDLLDKSNKEVSIADRKEKLFTKVFDIYLLTNGTWQATDWLGTSNDFKRYFPNLIGSFEDSIESALKLYNDTPVRVEEQPKRFFPVIEDLD